MQGFKTFLESVDALIKVGIAIVAALFFGIEKERLSIEQDQQNLTKAVVETLQVQQTSNLAVTEKIIDLLFEEKNKCLAEDQFFFIEFLIDVNNQYNRVQINKDEFYRASAARHNCAGSQTAVGIDARLAAEASHGAIPVLDTPAQITELTARLQGGIQVQAVPTGNEKADGYVSVGVFNQDSQTFRNFDVAKDKASKDGHINPATVIKAKWSVYLRANMTDTEAGQNPILGIVPEGGCVRVLDSTPAVRGQTWAAVKLASCS